MRKFAVVCHSEAEISLSGLPRNLSLAELGRMFPAMVEDAARRKRNVIVRPRGPDEITLSMEAEITLSMVKWGWVRRSALFWGKKLGIIDRFYIALFIPKYEIAVYEGRAKGNVFSKRAFFQNFRYIFYYPDAAIASRKWDELVSILEREGIFGTAEFIGAGDPEEQDFVSNLNFEEYLNRLFQ
jgi:hypothetical protein